MKNPSFRNSLRKAALAVAFFLTPLALSAQDASSDGALVWTYSIKLPPGRNGMGPSLSINYNSFGGNSFLGMGMQLGGLSAITRDQAYGIYFNSSDHFLLDGQKLVNTGGYTYHKERETYEKIEVSGDPNNTSSYWTVTAKNGTKYYYGRLDSDHTSANDGRIPAVGQGGKALVWLLSRVEDVHGNYYVIEYLEDDADGDYYPTKITYTKSTVGGVSKYHAIEFSYETRTDATVLYLPTRFRMDRQLKWITVKAGGNLVRKYRLDYEYGVSTQSSRLTAIQEYGNDGTSTLPSTTLAWSGNSLPGYTYSWNLDCTMPDSTNYQLYFADVNGDGLVDIIRRGVGESGPNAQYVGYIWLSLNQGNGFQNWPWNSGLSVVPDGDPISFADINGDGKADFIWTTKTGYHDTAKVALSAGTGFNFWSFTLALDNVYVTANTHFTDVTGDGRADLVVRNTGAPNPLSECLGYVYVGESLGNTFSKWTYNSNGDVNAGLITFADVNGDGKSDLIAYGASNDQMKVALSTGAGFTFWSWTQAFSFTTGFQFADVNGDGRADLVGTKNTGGAGEDSQICLGLGNGNSFENWTYSSGGLANLGSFMLRDVNADGRADIVSVANGEIKISLSRGGSFGGVSGFWDVTTNISSDELLTIDEANGDGKADILAKAANGDLHAWLGSPANVSDLLTSVHNPMGGSATVTYLPAAQLPGAVNSSGKSYPYIANARPHQLVRIIKYDNGLGNVGSLVFGYQDGMLRNGPMPERKNFGFKTATRKDDHTKTYTVTTCYQPTSADDEWKGGLVNAVSVHNQNGDPDTVYSVKLYLYDKRVDNPSCPSVKFVFKTHEYLYDYDGNSESRDEYVVLYPASSYDERGNLKLLINKGRVVRYGDGTLNEDDDTKYDNVTIQTDWVTDAATNISVLTETRKYAYGLDNAWALASETRYLYDGKPQGQLDGKGLLTGIEYENGTTDPAVKFGYDTYGNLLWTRDPQTPLDSTYPTSEIEYDGNYKAYFIKAFNALRHYGQIIYDSLMRPVKTIDANLVETNVEYDYFNRAVKSILPGDTSGSPTSRTEFNDTPSLPTSPCSVKTYAKENASGTLDSVQYFDGLGRVIQTKSEKGVSAWATVDFYYDASGRLYKQSVPYETSDSAYTPPDETQPSAHVEFDAMNRVTKSHNTDGTYNMTTYEKRIITSYDALTHKVINEFDGNTVIVRNFAGPQFVTTTTKSCWDGSRITDNDGNIIQNIMDNLGNSLSFTDPDMGTWMYEYDANSNLTTQTDAKGQVITLDYDVLNRPVREYHAGVLKAEYWYDGEDSTQPEMDHGKYKGRLTKIVWHNGSGGSESYKYDARGRIIESTVKIGTYERTELFAYDSMNRVTSQIFPIGTDGTSGREILNAAYGTDGNITDIWGKGQTRASGYAHDLLYMIYGKLKQIVYGNGVTTAYDYYDNLDIDGNTIIESNDGRTNSYRLRGIRSENTSGLVIADTQYGYDSVGNIKFKSFSDSQGFSYSENFYYDTLNRLTAATSYGFYGLKNYTYDALNNISTKTNHFDGLEHTWYYVYDAHVSGRENKLPHAVSSIVKNGRQVYTFSYDQNGNMTEQRGLTKIEIQAKRSDDSLQTPVMELWVNYERQIGWEVLNTEYAAYKWNGNWDEIGTIDVVFRNGDGPGVSVANLSVDSIKVNGVVFQAEVLPAWYDEGSYDEDCFDAEYISHGNETFSWAGALRFRVTGAPPLTRNIGYDACNRVTEINDGGEVTTYNYGPLGRRVSKTEGGTTTYYFFANYELEVTENQETQILYYNVNGQQIAQRNIVSVNDVIQNEQLLYIHKDHLGSAVRLTDTAGEVVQTLVYDPFGQTIFSSGLNEPTNQYTGQKKDASGLYCYGTRYYDPEIGRFISPDTVLDGLNRYAYCGNNPINYVDPTGNEVTYSEAGPYSSWHSSEDNSDWSSWAQASAVDSAAAARNARSNGNGYDQKGGVKGPGNTGSPASSPETPPPPQIGDAYSPAKPPTSRSSGKSDRNANGPDASSGPSVVKNNNVIKSTEATTPVYPYPVMRGEKPNITIVVVKNKEKYVDRNDVAFLLINGHFVEVLLNVQAEKNYPYNKQTWSQRWEPEYSDENYPCATLTDGEYTATIDRSGKYLTLTSPDAQLEGFSKKGILAIWEFLVHSNLAFKNTNPKVSNSIGCHVNLDANQIILMRALRQYGMKPGDSCRYIITTEGKWP